MHGNGRRLIGWWKRHMRVTRPGNTSTRGTTQVTGQYSSSTADGAHPQKENHDPQPPHRTIAYICHVHPTLAAQPPKPPSKPFPAASHLMMVLSLVQSSNRIEYPTSLPSLTSISSATRAATLMAATRRGCVHPILPALEYPASWRYWVIWVVLPAPAETDSVRGRGFSAEGLQHLARVKRARTACVEAAYRMHDVCV